MKPNAGSRTKGGPTRKIAVKEANKAPATHGLGGVRDRPDARDHIYVPPAGILKNLPPGADLRKHFPPVYNQEQINSCHDEETEVLTASGFKLFSELRGEELLATVNPTNSELSFEKPSRVIRVRYQGPVFCAENWSLSFRVTPEHRMLIRKWDEARRALANEYAFVEVSKLGWYCGLMNRISWSGDSAASEMFTLPGVLHKHKPQREALTVPMGAWLRFLGIYLAEGTVLEEDGRYKIQLAASKTREKQFIRDVLAGIGQHYLELDDRFTFDNRRLYETMEGLGLRGVHAPQKFVPEFVFHQSAENIREFLLGHWMGDGGGEDHRRAHYTSSVKLANDLQRLVLLSGEATVWTSRAQQMSVMTDGRVVEPGFDMQRVSVRTQRSTSIDRKEQVFTDEYDGHVYCAEVPTHHTLVTRRHGKILISGNCTANAIAGAMEFDAKKQGMEEVFTPSRLFLYYNERLMEGTEGKDVGAAIRDGIKSIVKQGDCPEHHWPYDSKLVTQKPHGGCYSQARSFKAIEYQKIGRDLDHMRACLASGYPFVFGIRVFTSFQGNAVHDSGHLKMPRKGEKTIGLHAVVACGYDDKNRWFIVRNSWGSGWGMKGYYTMPYEYLMDSKISHDFWTIRVVR